MKTSKLLRGGLALAVTAISWQVLAARPKYAELPLVSDGGVKSLGDVPAEIPAKEKTKDVFLALPPPSGGMSYGQPDGLRYFGVFADERRAKDFTAGNYSYDAVSGIDTTCFVVADSWYVQSYFGTFWPLGRDSFPQMSGAAKGSEAAKQYTDYTVPKGLRIERLSVGDAPALDVTMAWLDPSTFGVRQLSRSALPLKAVAKSVGGVRVFAAREEGGKIHFVVYNPPSGSPSHVGRYVTMNQGQENGSSDCGHAHFVLSSAPGAGEQASAQMDVILPDLPSNDKKPADGMRELRIRSLMVHLGVSQASAEDDPVPTVSFGWSGRERRQEAF
jgi:hypothetical protein